jgi:hypothetical protein
MFTNRRTAALIAALLLLVLTACNPAGPSVGVLPTPLQPTAVPIPTSTAAPAAIATAEATGGSTAAGPATATTVARSLALQVLDAVGTATQRTIDGNALQLVARLAPAPATDTIISFALAGPDLPLGQCTLTAGSDDCSLSLRADGWAWEARTLVKLRTVTGATADGLRAETILAVTPKPIVLVHGLNSDQRSWTAWIKPDGFLAGMGMVGYAVDDEQFGTRRMNTGNPAKPLDKTFSIAENAQVVAEYVEAVRRNTGAERVDLVAHSLGGLISRYYVQNLMPIVESPGLPDVPVANQLVMAGTPNAGTPCGRIPAALGLMSPATTQITPEYMAQVFNQTVNDRRGVPFFGLAGDAVQEKVAIRCTELPTDRYVSVRSVLQGVSVTPDQIEGFHSDLNNGRASFERIFASIARSPGEYPIQMAPITEPLTTPERVDSTLVQGGTINAGQTVSVTITLDQATEASFILYAPGSTVNMRIKTVAGAILTEETPATNPNVTFERIVDSDLPLSLGYGVINPRAGAWEIGLTAVETPPGGGQFALVATLQSDLQLDAGVTPAIAAVGQPVAVSARLTSPQPVQGATVQAQIAGGAGTDLIFLSADGQGGFAGQWTPETAGEYTVEVMATGLNDAGQPFERLGVLGVSVR